MNATTLNEAKVAVQDAEKTLQSIEREKAKADAQLETIEQQIRDLGFDLDNLEAQVASLETNVKEVLSSVNDRIEELRNTFF